MNLTKQFILISDKEQNDKSTNWIYFTISIFLDAHRLLSGGSRLSETVQTFQRLFGNLQPSAPACSGSLENPVNIVKTSKERQLGEILIRCQMTLTFVFWSKEASALCCGENSCQPLASTISFSQSRPKTDDQIKSRPSTSAPSSMHYCWCCTCRSHTPVYGHRWRELNSFWAATLFNVSGREPRPQCWRRLVVKSPALLICTFTCLWAKYWT